MRLWARTRWRRLLVRVVVLIILLLLGVWGIRPFGTFLDALGRANSGASEFEDIQITETSTKIITHQGVVSFNNCSSSETKEGETGGEKANHLDISITDPFDTYTVYTLLENKYKFPGWEPGGRTINIADLPMVVPGTDMQYSWNADEQQWTGQITSKSQPGVSMYLVTRWFELKLVPLKNLGCLF